MDGILARTLTDRRVERVFNPYLFRGQGALMTTGAILAPFGDSALEQVFPDISPEQLETFQEILQGFDDRAFAVFLRWQLNPAIGLPSEPFRVWRRLAMPLTDAPAPVTVERTVVPPLGTVHQFAEPQLVITVRVRSLGPALNVLVIALSGGIGFDNIVQTEAQAVPSNGTRLFVFQAPYLTGVLINGADGQEIEISGDALGAAGKIDDWELVETVGLPVDPAEFSDLPGQSHGKEQGLVGAEVPARDAAAQRFARGISPFGWYPSFPAGGPAPKWELPAALDMVQDAQDTLLPMLHEALRLRPVDQLGYLEERRIQPPENPTGARLPADDGRAEISPIKLLQMAVSTDPLQAVALGFGTGLAYEDVPPITFGDRVLFGDPNVADYDYMVTGRWHVGLRGDGEPLEIGVIIPRPPKAVPPPPPTDLRYHFLAHQRPAAPDGPWVASSRLSWERLPLANLSPVASFAFARLLPASGAPATALMEPRPHGTGVMPIGNNENTQDPEYPRQSASDQGLPIPNAPGSISARYGVANQNLFGLWSRWVTQGMTTSQPAPDLVNLISATLRPLDTGSGTVCPADLVVEFVVDWRARSVARVDFRGRLYAAATRHDEPPAGPPPGLQLSLGGAVQAIAITFSGDVPSIAMGSVEALDAQGSATVSPPGFATQGHARRYRVTIPGFSLDYAATPHVGLALQARLREALAPGRQGEWGRTKLTFASDPRARPTSVVEIVPLASLPDAAGECHARIAWQPIPSAEGYILYTTTETRMLSSRDLAGPDEGETLSTRLARLKDLFNASPDRRDFTRVNKALLEVTSLDVALPRGSQAIHLWLVIPVSAGGVEGPWPAGPAAADQLVVYAAPRVATPAPPTIEAQRVEVPGGFAARLRIGTRAASGARPERVDIHRTRVGDAARALDSMGPAIAELTASTGPWVVETDGAGMESWITAVHGEDTPGGSWQPIWYRAVAWGADDGERGVRRGRGRPSPAVAVTVPPAGPPQLGAPTLSWPGGGFDDLLASFSAPVPVPPTTLGPHTLSAEVRLDGAADLFFYTVPPESRDDPRRPGQKLPGAIPLDRIPETPLVTETGLWRLPDGLQRNYRLLIRRPSGAPAGSLILRLADPIGRVTERTLRFAEGSIVSLPDLSPVDRFEIAGQGTFYTVSTDAEPGGPFPYMLRVVLRLPGSSPVFDPFGGLTRFDIERRRPSNDGLTSTGGRRGRIPLTPRPGPVLDLGIVRRSSPFRRVGDDLIYEAPLADVPVAGRLPNDPLAPLYDIARQAVGARQNITVVARADIAAVRFTISLPDGRSVSQSARG